MAQAGTALTAASALATVRASITGIRSLSVESRTDLFARFPEGARLAVFAEFPEFTGAPAAPTTAAAQVLPPFALPILPTRPDPTATGRALAEATEAKLRALIRTLEAAATAAAAETAAKVAAAGASALEAAATTAAAEATAKAAAAEASAAPFVPPDMDAILARIAALETAPHPV